jgi:integrase
LDSGTVSALALRWRDTDQENGTISINQSLGRSLTQGLIFTPPKTQRGKRTIDIGDSTIEVLKAHKGMQILERSVVEDSYEDSGLVFADPFGRPLNPMALTRAFQGLARKAGVQPPRLHDLRHFHATMMLQLRQNPVIVSQRLGHASVSITMDIYAHALPAWQKEAARTFANALAEG